MTRRAGFKITGRAVVAALLLGSGLSGCGAAAGDGKTQVVASLYPYAYLAQRVGGARVDVVDLTAQGVEPHDVELTPQQIASVIDGDVILYEQGFQPAVDAAVAESPAQHVLDVSALVTLRGPSSAPDPHVWLDPAAMITITGALTDQLGAADPAHAEVFRSRADTLKRQLKELDRRYRGGLADCVRTTVVTSHAAFGYLAHRYGLRMLAVAGLDPQAEPSPERQAQLIDRIRASGVTTIFTETLSSPAIAESLAAETGTSVATLDPIEGLTTKTADATYFSLMRANLEALRQANGCR